MAEIILTGTVTCPPDRLSEVRAALPDHIALSRAEPGCLSFAVTETTPGTFAVAERFADRAAFDAHQTRTAASPWAEVSRDLPRTYEILEA